MQEAIKKGISGKAIFAIVAAVVALLMIPMVVEEQDASEIMVIQYPITGELEVFTEPGMHAQLFGKVTTYPRQAQYSFCSQQVQNTDVICNEPNVDTIGKRLRFSEGGHATLNGAAIWEMPLDSDSILKIHKKFNGPDAVEAMAVAKMIDTSIYLSGTLMTSTESSGSRRSELLRYIDDQASNGAYMTKSKQEITQDATGANQTVTVTEILIGKDGQPMRQQGSLLAEFNINLLPISFNALNYDSVVEKQIADRQKSTTDVQLAIADAVKAEQSAKTVEAQGRALAAKAKWDQETIKAQKVTEAQQQYEVAALKAKEAEQYKRQQILIGEGNATKQRLEMQANGALEQKLAAYVEVNKAYADAISKYQGAWVPTTMIGGSGNGGHNGAQNLIDMLNVKTAKDLALDMSVRK